SRGRKVPVLKTTATTGEGVPELVDAINDIGSEIKSEGAAARRRRRVRYLIARAAADLVAERVRHGGNEGLDNLSDQVLAGDLSPEAAARRLLER
ncbi:MAG: methylmalonyl Co-A mutase-associated GTPase MeaB, partial [Hyphomicrobium sp.]